MQHSYNKFANSFPVRAVFLIRFMSSLLPAKTSSLIDYIPSKNYGLSELCYRSLRSSSRMVGRTKGKQHLLPKVSLMALLISFFLRMS
jgi:hypothetical protein